MRGALLGQDLGAAVPDPSQYGERDCLWWFRAKALESDASRFESIQDKLLSSVSSHKLGSCVVQVQRGKVNHSQTS